jgi:hypothetical protein
MRILVSLILLLTAIKDIREILPPVPELPPKTYKLPKTAARPWQSLGVGGTPEIKEFGPRQLVSLLEQPAVFNHAKIA